jgi:hypothetical protein
MSRTRLVMSMSVLRQAVEALSPDCRKVSGLFIFPARHGDTGLGTRRLEASNTLGIAGAADLFGKQAKKGLRPNGWRNVGRTYFRQLVLLSIAGQINKTYRLWEG